MSLEHACLGVSRSALFCVYNMGLVEGGPTAPVEPTRSWRGVELAIAPNDHDSSHIWGAVHTLTATAYKFACQLRIIRGLGSGAKPYGNCLRGIIPRKASEGGNPQNDVGRGWECGVVDRLVTGVMGNGLFIIIITSSRTRVSSTHMIYVYSSRSRNQESNKMAAAAVSQPASSIPTYNQIPETKYERM